MYTRIPTGRYPRGMRVPENYGGNAFRPIVNEAVSEEEPAVPDESPSPLPLPTPELPPPEAPPEPHAPVGRFSLGLPFLRRDGGGIGFEELLLVGLIFLIAEEGKHDDLIWLLLLLLLIS